MSQQRFVSVVCKRFVILNYKTTFTFYLKVHLVLYIVDVMQKAIKSKINGN